MDLDKKSRILIKALRHTPETLNLKLDNRGWASVDSVLKSLQIDNSQLDVIISTNNKKRFEYDESRRKIRASQGHSIKNIEVYKDWELYIPIGYLFHGTASHTLDPILKGSLISQSRTHVHLSKDISTAYNVGKRHGSPIILQIDAIKMYNDGFIFYESKNGVILTEKVPSIYIKPLDKGQLILMGFDDF